ncbi:hypothetical protein PS645_01472 [Pseudomonas fluorescens]|uniref:Uncharacterized protein n=1 Tax=Pseudomonas fluorescens TaxID=294 RepID=A0A5E6RLP5_PSEFL|nr:hypothetical protein [Pseudomonas fluorescens]VVM64998.1 hypothetical protein PS645_01472 [Pseudomonas fluorescens]
MNSVESFRRSYAVAVARVKDRSAKQQVTVRQVGGEVATKAATTKPITTTQLDRDEQYQATITKLMINHIKQKKEPHNE